ncbi:hypothetical protein VFPPC_15419 [Pochonia chlamydosporia 170]|uniref:Uncharacterized protein n=1 Tax=Pochonia chlamydosporia 170 TaxID=1380566 RepID=A0A179G9Q8_METCM|nr:hypothetical protein VFPPC_15419 [Pochonia chlamydosporia 170]OAQ74123.1 hypothetical protein VFPPC_15419 [Pochonia chlamydosporia 170]
MVSDKIGRVALSLTLTLHEMRLHNMMDSLCEERSDDEKCKPTVVEAEDESILLAQYGVERRSDGFIYWRRDSSHHPRNWSSTRKLFDTSVIVLLEFYT